MVNETGYSGSGNFTQSWGSNTVSNELVIAVNDLSTGTYNLQGGTLAAATIILNSGGEFNHTHGGDLNFNLFNQNGGLSTIDNLFLGKERVPAAPIA